MIFYGRKLVCSISTIFFLVEKFFQRLFWLLNASNCLQPWFVVCCSHINARQVWCCTFYTMGYCSYQCPMTIGSFYHQWTATVTLENFQQFIVIGVLYIFLNMNINFFFILSSFSFSSILYFSFHFF